ncbi:MalY/PatB family protein [Solicola gregarius]|uniref:cysteine-S-conjugate beta-lyase n=1 Tax=Solicola gregarius TaxID=2908642 RepID=A0AA46YMK7_9ACTN|nr:MalY/PatB family protein [Solicola gregarius]UYM06719.1 pyridoxal phosphate-dependent aminotransferase [Solicola gregarius]
MAQLPVDDIERLRQRRSVKWRAHDRDALPLPVAEMDFQLAPPIRRELHAAVDRSDTGYAYAGTDLTDALTGFAKRRWDWTIAPDSVTVVADVGVGCVELIRMLCKPGDGVVVNPPVYAPFFEWIAETGRQVVEAPLDGGLRLDLDALEAAFAKRPAVYLLCNPHNPVGRVHTPEELAAVVRLAAQYDVRVISDEVHAPLVLPGAAHTPLLTVPGADDVAIALVAASKAWNLAGLKCAQIVTASSEMRSVTDRLPVNVRYRVGHFGVIASVAAYTEGEAWLDDLLETLDARRDLLGRLLAESMPEVRWQRPDATYLGWLDCRAIGPDAEPYEKFLAAGVVTDPGPKFGTGGGGHVRLNLATSEEILTEAVERMSAA